MTDHQSTMQHVKQLVKELTGQANMLTTPRVFLEMTRDHAAALFLAQVIFWSERTPDPDGWFYKSDAEWLEELVMSRHQVQEALKILAAYGVEKIVRRVPGRTGPQSHYRIVLDVFYTTFCEFLTQRSVNFSQNEIQKTDRTIVLQKTYRTLKETKTTTKTTGGGGNAPATAAASRVGGSRKVATEVPDPFPLTDELRAFAARTVPAVNVDEMTGHFVDYHRTAHTRSDDWEAKWRIWVRRERSFQQERQGPSVPGEGGPPQDFQAYLARKRKGTGHDPVRE